MKAHTVLLENQRNIVIQNRNVPPALKDSLIQRNIKRPAEHHPLKFLNYMERFWLVKTFPHSQGCKKLVAHKMEDLLVVTAFTERNS